MFAISIYKYFTIRHVLYYRLIEHGWSSLALSNDPKDVARAVRCLKNPAEDPEE